MSRHELIADLLMGAAFADKQLDPREFDKVKSLLCGLLRAEVLPVRLVERLKKFNPGQFDVAATCSKLGFKTDEEKRYMLDLIAAVHESDELWDLDEDAYLRSVATALRLPEDKWQDLTVGMLSIDSIGQSLLPDLPDG